MITYALVLQTISTLAGVVGVGLAVYLSVILPRIHRAVDGQTAELKQSIERQTEELKR